MSSYDKVYLDHMLKEHEYLFRLFSRKDINTFDAIRLYMISEQRALMDIGNSKAINMTPKQLINRMFEQCSLHSENDDCDEFILNWMARIYVLLQFQTSKSSTEIVNRVSPEWLYNNYSPLHETSDTNGVSKVLNKFWNDTSAESSSIVGFHSEGKKNGFLSNWYLSKFSVGDKYFTSVEQWLMYNKASVFGDTIVADSIMQEICPNVIKELGRKVKNFEESKWARARYDILVRGLEAKFSQSKELKKLLLATNDCILVEFSKTDRIYGVGIGDEDPNRFNTSIWNGMNLLGNALMQIRDSLSV